MIGLLANLVMDFPNKVLKLWSGLSKEVDHLINRDPTDFGPY